MSRLFFSYLGTVLALSFVTLTADNPSTTVEPIQALTKSVAPVIDDTVIKGMVGRQPKLLCWLMKKFKEGKRSEIDMVLRRILFYGPPGNGKSTLAKKFADETGSIFIARSASSMVEKYVGQGANNVAELFSTARQLEGKKVIFIDEIDAIATINSGEFRAEHKAALQQLWIELDQCKDDPNIFVCFATNDFKKLSKTFIDRFGYNTLEIPNPNVSLRRKIIAFYVTKAALPLSPELIKKLAQQTEGLSNRSLEDMVYGIKMMVDLQSDGQFSEPVAWKVLTGIKKKFEENISEAAELEEAQNKKLQKVNTLVSIVSGSLSSVLNSYYLYVIAAGILLGGAVQAPLAHSA